MNDTHRVAGVMLILGSLLNLTRVIPILLSEGVTMDNFPPKTVEDTVLFSQLFGYYISHIMGLLSVPMLMFGVVVLAGEVRSRGADAAGLATVIGMVLGLGLYFIALMTDGLVLPTVVQNVLRENALNQVAIDEVLITSTHVVAAMFAGFGAAAMVVTMYFLGTSLAKGFNNILLGGFGMALGVVSALGYAIGFLGFHITQELNRVGPLMMLMFLYIIVIGFSFARNRLEPV